MSTKKTIFVCQICGHESSKWLGKCPGCNGWNTFSEERESSVSTNTKKSLSEAEPIKLNEVTLYQNNRTLTGIEEVDRVFGGGIVNYSLILLGGAPGIGKSTITLQIAEKLGKEGRVLYVSAEESEAQIKMRADRLNIKSENIYLLTETSYEAIIRIIEKIKPLFVIVDSIQTIYADELKSTPGSIGQLREVTFKFMENSKKLKFTTILIGHITKDGAIAGPKVLEHMVDTVLYFEGEEKGDLRILRSIKNRFGATNEIGIFEMQGDGLKEVKNPSLLFMTNNNSLTPGNSIIPIIEGTRPIVVEIQALILKTNYQMPTRTIVGLDRNRISMLLAIMDKYLNLKFATSDVYINVVSGFKIEETACDLGVMASLISNYLERPLPIDVSFVGEASLNGEVRGVSFIESRIKEIQKLGIKKVFIPLNNHQSVKDIFPQMEIVPITNIKELFRYINSL